MTHDVEHDIPFGRRRLAFTVAWDRGQGLIGVRWQSDQLSGPGPGIVIGLGYLTVGVYVYEDLAPDDVARLARWRTEYQPVDEDSDQ
jgi:hypothetical protein